MSRLLTLVSLFFSAAPLFVRASPCLAMDATFNLLVFGLGGKDFNAGTQTSWNGSTPATDITTTGRPPFDGSNTTCYLSQFTNAIYALSADSANPTSVYIYDAGAKSWSAQSVTDQAGSSGLAFDPANFDAILDHDTNVFYALSNGELFFLDMAQEKTANSTALPWVDVGKPSFDTTNYQPVMALASNHIHFLDVPGLSAGQADIFVIHFSFFQPAAQSYPVTGGSNFPLQHGQATSFFQSSGVQQEFAYIPDDGSATYVVNVITNTTQQLAGPTTKDPKATYFAGITSLVQLDSSGNVMFLPYQQGNTGANSQAAWTKVSTVVAPPANSTTSSEGSSATATNSGSSPSGTAISGSSANGAAGKRVMAGLAAVTMGLAIAAVLL